MSQKRKFTNVIRIGDSIHYNEALGILLPDKQSIIKVNPVALGYFKDCNRMFIEAYIDEKTVFIDFEMIYSCLNKEKNHDHKTTTNRFDTVIFKRPE